MHEDSQAIAFASVAEQSEQAAKAMREDALRLEGMRSAFLAASEKSMTSVLARLKTDLESGKVTEEQERVVKGYLRLALLALDNAKSGAESTRVHTLGKAQGFETAAKQARAREKSARAASAAMSERITAGESEEDARRPKPSKGLTDAKARMPKQRPAKKTGKKKAKARARKKKG